MNWDAISAVGEILGALAVFVSLIYLARQIKFSALSTRSQMEADLAQRGFQAYDPVYQGENAKIYHRGLTQPDTLSAEDAFVFDLLMNRQFGTMAELAYQIEKGVIESDSTYIVGYREHFRHALLAYPGARQWFEDHQPFAGNVLTRLGLSLD